MISLVSIRFQSADGYQHPVPFVSHHAEKISPVGSISQQGMLISDSFTWILACPNTRVKVRD
jgi:hypothetical protein